MKRSKTTPNRKALPKFLKWLLISAVFGFCVGIASGILDDLDVGVWLTDGLIRLLTVIAPWGIPISSVVLLGICLWHYRSAKSLFDRWAARTTPPRRRRTGSSTWWYCAPP